MERVLLYILLAIVCATAIKFTFYWLFVAVMSGAVFALLVSQHKPAVKLTKVKSEIYKAGDSYYIIPVEQETKNDRPT